MLKLTICPTCGSGRVRRVRGTVSGKVRGRRYRAEGVSFYACPDCSERIYDREAMGAIAAARAGRRGDPGPRTKGDAAVSR